LQLRLGGKINDTQAVFVERIALTAFEEEQLLL
jgi:hypothetical protein